MGKGRTKGAQGVDTPKKAQISRDYQAAGGSQIRGAAAAVARKHGLNPTSGPGRVKKWDAEIRDGVASRAKRRSSGRPKGLSPEVKQNIEDVFREDDTQTYREAAEKLGLPASTLHDYATKDLDYRCLNQTVRPYPSEANRDKRITISQGIVGTPAPYKNEFHQDEKYYIVKARRRQRKVKKSDKAGSAKVSYAHSRRHGTQVMFTGRPSGGRPKCLLTR